MYNSFWVLTEILILKLKMSLICNYNVWCDGLNKICIQLYYLPPQKLTISEYTNIFILSNLLYLELGVY